MSHAVRLIVVAVALLAGAGQASAQEPTERPGSPVAMPVANVAAPPLPDPGLPAASADPEDPPLSYGLVPRPAAGLPPATSGGFTYTPGEGVTISMLNDTSRLRLSASLSALLLFNEKRPFTSGAPFLLLPDSPFGLRTNTFDLHARQSSLFASFEGPEFGGFTPRGTILTFFFNDALAAAPFASVDEFDTDTERGVARRARLGRVVGNPRERRTLVNLIKAVVHNGRIETEQPLDLPDGTELLIAIPDHSPNDESAVIDFMTEDEQSTDPEHVESWVDTLLSIPPPAEDPASAAESQAWDAEMRRFNIDAVRRQFEEGTR